MINIDVNTDCWSGRWCDVAVVLHVYKILNILFKCYIFKCFYTSSFIVNSPLSYTVPSSPVPLRSLCTSVFLSTSMSSADVEKDSAIMCLIFHIKLLLSPLEYILIILNPGTLIIFAYVVFWTDEFQ